MLLPIFLLVSFIIILDDGLPILFKQKRIGLNSSYFWIYKFRTMKNNTPNLSTDLLKDSTSLYTYSGPFFRELSIDELPQLLNIIKGEMNFIGPRPALYNQFDLISRRKKMGIDQLKPGITGWAQINGRDDLSVEKKVEFDKYYLDNKSIKLNLKIFFLTIIKILKKEGVYTNKKIL